MEWSIIIILVYSTIIGDIIERISSRWAGNLFKSFLWLACSFTFAIMLNFYLKEEIIDKEKYLFNYPFCYIIALIGCVYLLSVMLGKGKKKKNKISKDAFNG